MKFAVSESFTIGPAPVGAGTAESADEAEDVLKLVPIENVLPDM
jgi:hypothetical protein